MDQGSEADVQSAIHTFHYSRPSRGLANIYKTKTGKDGMTLPGMNFCGPGNKLNHIPTSFLDSLCHLHDMMYKYRNTEEFVDDKMFMRILSQWKSTPGTFNDGWTGPTANQRLFTIPLMEAIFNMKGAANKDHGNRYLLMVLSKVLEVLRNYKDLMTINGNDPEWDFINGADHLSSIKNYVNWLKSHAKEFEQYPEEASQILEIVGLADSIDHEYEKQSALPPELQARWYKKHVAAVQRAGQFVESTRIFQFIPNPSGGEGWFIMNTYADGKWWSAVMLTEDGEKEYEYMNWHNTLIVNPMTKSKTSGLPYYQEWNLRSQIMQEEKKKEKYDDGEVWQHVQLKLIYAWGYAMGDESAQNYSPKDREKFELYNSEDAYS